MTTTKSQPLSGPPIEKHETHSRRLIRHALEQLEKGNRLQASEKAWGAVVHQLKAIANARGEVYEVHRQVYPLVKRLARRTDDPVLFRALFSTANGLHKNYYVDAMPLDELRYEIDRVRDLLDILERPGMKQPEAPPAESGDKPIETGAPPR